MSSELQFTGERFTPECQREILYEHLHRYALAARLCTGRRVLDAACGEGYGSAMLAGVARSVTGVDLAVEAVEHARARYAGPDNLEFLQGDCTDLPFEDHAFDCIVSFETLEHLEDQQGMLAEFDRILAPDGFLLLSSPDRATYSDLAGNRNEYHVRELYRDELEELLARHFSHVRLLGQRLMFHSVIWDLAESGHAALQQMQEGELDEARWVPNLPMYYLALCARSEQALPELPARLWLFDDAEESVYRHYQGEIRRNMQAGAILAERDREIAELKSRLGELKDNGPASDTKHPPAGPSSWLRRLLGRG